MYQGSPIAPITYAERVQRLPTAELYLLLSIHTRSGAAIAYQQNTLQLYHRLACIGRSRGGRLTIHSYPKSATPQLRHLRICPRRSPHFRESAGGVVSSPRSTPPQPMVAAPLPLAVACTFAACMPHASHRVDGIRGVAISPPRSSAPTSVPLVTTSAEVVAAAIQPRSTPAVVLLTSRTCRVRAFATQSSNPQTVPLPIASQ